MKADTRSALFLILVACVAHVTAYLTPGASAANSTQAQIRPVDDSIFPDKYPQFVKEVYVLLREAEQLRQFSAHDREVALRNQPREREMFLRGLLEKEELKPKPLYTFVRAQVGETGFEAFLQRYGIDPDNREDIGLEVLAQMNRMRRRESYYEFVQKFSDVTTSRAGRVELAKASRAPRELEYALRHCEEEEFGTLRDIVVAKDGFGPQTPQDRDLLDAVEQKRRAALTIMNGGAATKWRAVIAQLVSQPSGKVDRRLPFSKPELFAMVRNAERTLGQRKRPFVVVTNLAELDNESAADAVEIIHTLGAACESPKTQPLIAYAFLDRGLAGELKRLNRIYGDILSNEESAQTTATQNSIRKKKELLESLENAACQRIKTELEAPRKRVLRLVRTILAGRGQPYRFPFIRGIILFKGNEGRLAYRFVEDFPMIVAGETYPYQWKHDNEVNIALLLANVSPYEAAQAVRFIIYHGMWRSEGAKRLGLYGWLSQIIFGNRQTGRLPAFNNKIYYYFPDFRFRPTTKIDAEKERNRTSEITQLPFFGWTVWRVYEELTEIKERHGVAFLKEVYPYVRANTEAIHAALDPYDEAVLSGRDAWVNGMDNAWYHLLVMTRHLPERFIPDWAMEVVEKNRVDNRVDKKPRNPVDPKLARGRPSDYYYASKIVFYNIVKELGLEPVAVYNASPYNAKDVAITAVMARSLEAQIAMAKVLRNTDTDLLRLSALRGRKNEIVGTWNEEIKRYQAYLDRMKKAVNEHLWEPQDKTYYNRDVTRMFRSVVEQQFCRLGVGKQGQILCDPRMKYWNCEAPKQGRGYCVLTQEARESLDLDERLVSVGLDSNGTIHYGYKFTPQYWTWDAGKHGSGRYQLNVRTGDPLIVEQFSHPNQDGAGNLWYEPKGDYWTCLEDQEGARTCELNERAERLMAEGARKIEDGDSLRSPAIAGFFPMFGHIPSAERASQLALQLVNPWMWWPVNGIPIPTQPMMIQNADGQYVSNRVYDPDRYWLGPAWMASTKPVIDGFYSYGYRMLYLYIVQRSVGTLQDGRAVEHWNPETGEVNTSNVNFPWAASCMAGSIWRELTKEEQLEYLRRFHSRQFAQSGP